MREALALVAAILMGLFAAANSMHAFSKEPAPHRLSPVYNKITLLENNQDLTTLTDLSRKLTTATAQFPQDGFIAMTLKDLNDQVKQSLLLVRVQTSDRVQDSDNNSDIATTNGTMPDSILLALSELFIQ